MRRFLILSVISLWLITTITTPPLLTRAQTMDIPSGLPDSPKFGYGAHLDINGWQPIESITIAANMGLEWLAVNFNWATLTPAPEISPNLDMLNSIMAAAQQSGCYVLISITAAPTWALTPNGPDPATVASLVVNLARAYPGVIKAVELFPEANTSSGWGASPNPANYLYLLQTVDSALKADNQTIVIVAGGLVPQGLAQEQSGTLDDLAFLQSLYDLGGASIMPIISLHLDNITGDPLAAPSSEEHRVLRHYEEIRQVMLNADHRNGLIWITSLAWPQGTIQANDSIYADPQEQAHWLEQAYKLLIAQLYMGAAFFEPLNSPNSEFTAATAPALIPANSQLHPAFIRLGQLIAPGSTTPAPMPSTSLVKKLVRQVDYKPSQS